MNTHSSSGADERSPSSEGSMTKEKSKSKKGWKNAKDAPAAGTAASQPAIKLMRLELDIKLVRYFSLAAFSLVQNILFRRCCPADDHQTSCLVHFRLVLLRCRSRLCHLHDLLIVARHIFAAYSQQWSFVRTCLPFPFLRLFARSWLNSADDDTHCLGSNWLRSALFGPELFSAWFR